MTDELWPRRFLETTRGRVLALLRRQPRTVSEMAELLDVTDAAIRSHVRSLERDGLAERHAVRRSGVGKPPRVYTATPQAEELFPKGYDAVLSAVLAELEEGLEEGELEDLLRRVGRRAAPEPAAAEDIGARLPAALEAVEALGGEPEVREDDDGLWIEGAACPLSGVVPEHPELCVLMEALLEEVLGTGVRERCRRDGVRPACAFLVRGGVDGA